MSAKTLRTPERLEVITRALRSGATRTDAAVYAGMDVRTLQRWCVASAAVQRACDEAEATAAIRATAVVMDDAFGRPAQYDDAGNVIRAEVKPNPQTAMWWLERRRPHEFGRRVTVDVRQAVERYASEHGLDADALIAEAEALLAEHAAVMRGG
jgi:hypothetical protein